MASLESIMPPRTLCSATRSCGGVRPMSDEFDEPGSVCVSVTSGSFPFGAVQVERAPPRPSSIPAISARRRSGGGVVAEREVRPGWTRGPCHLMPNHGRTKGTYPQVLWTTCGLCGVLCAQTGDEAVDYHVQNPELCA